MLISGIICLIPIIAGIILWNKMPEQIPIHWDANGNVNGYGSKFEALIALPGGLLLLALAMPWLLRMDPKYKNMSPALIKISIGIIPALSLVCSGLILVTTMGLDIAVQMIIPVIVGLVFILIGNYLPKTKQSYTMGIKLPWTLDNEENWNKTHRLGGFLWVGGGILMIVMGFIGIKTWLIIAVILIITIVPMIYSYLLYAKSKE